MFIYRKRDSLYPLIGLFRFIEKNRNLSKIGDLTKYFHTSIGVLYLIDQQAILIENSLLIKMNENIVLPIEGPLVTVYKIIQ